MAAGQNGTRADYTVFSTTVIVLGIGLGGWMLWQSQHGEISAGMMRFYHWQIQHLHGFTHRFDLADRQMLAANPDRVQIGTLIHMARALGQYLLIPAVGLVLWLAVSCFLYAASSRYCRALDLQGLMREQAATHPGIMPFINRSLRLVPLDKKHVRPLDPALNVREWVECYALRSDGGFDREAARCELIHQLGSPWQGVDKASPAVRCMLAAFMLHGAGKREEASELLARMAEDLSQGKSEGPGGPQAVLSFSSQVVDRADYWLKDRESLTALLGPLSQPYHAYATPMLMSALTRARLASGVLAPAQFNFLKLVDRGLWYALHSLGFPTSGKSLETHPNPRIEAIGARDHWAAERLCGHALRSPSVTQAVQAIEEAYARLSAD
jgi:intracellular multiplication protein IcmP